jgi:hypothetical protein
MIKFRKWIKLSKLTFRPKIPTDIYKIEDKKLKKNEVSKVNSKLTILPKDPTDTYKIEDEKLKKKWKSFESK